MKYEYENNGQCCKLKRVYKLNALWVVTSCSFIDMFQCFRRSCWMRIYCTWFLYWRRTRQISE